MPLPDPGGADIIKRDRRKRLEAVVKSLISLNDFSTTDAKLRCSETSPGYITRTIHQLADDGLLRRVLKQKRVLYRWSNPSQRATLVLRWIDRKVDGLQIKQSAVDLMVFRPDACERFLGFYRLLCRGCRTRPSLTFPCRFPTPRSF